MAELNHTVASGDTLYGIARKHGVDVGDLRTADGGAVPEQIKPGDTVVVPDNGAQGQCGTEGCREEADAVVNRAGKQDKLLDPKLAKANKDASKAPNSKINTSSTCSKKKYVVVIDPGHGGKDYSHSKAGSSWNNSVGVVSNVLEKTMSQRLAKLLKKSIEAQAKKAKGCSVTVYLTKTDENINLSGKDRAAVAKKRKADFFIVLHFNSYQAAKLFTQHKVTKRKYDQSHIMDITRGHKGTKRDIPAGFKRRLFSVKSSMRGPQIVKRSNSPKQYPLILNSVFAKSVTKRVLAAIKKLDNSPNTKTQSDHTYNVAVFSPSHNHKNGMVCCYLESDYINVESADRTWNPTQYTANIKSVTPKLPPLPVRKPKPGERNVDPALKLKTPPKTPPKAAAKAATGGQFYTPKKLPADGKMFQAAADAVAAAVIAAIIQSTKKATKGKAKSKTKGKP